MGPFRDKPAKQARETESDRLCALTARQLAAEVLPLFGQPDLNPNGAFPVQPKHVATKLLPDRPLLAPRPLIDAVEEALAVLEHADLLLRRQTGSHHRDTSYRLTALGRQVLTEGRVAAVLGVADSA